MVCEDIPVYGNRGDRPNFEPPYGIVELFMVFFLLPQPSYLHQIVEIGRIRSPIISPYLIPNSQIVDLRFGEIESVHHAPFRWPITALDSGELPLLDFRSRKECSLQLL